VTFELIHPWVVPRVALLVVCSVEPARIGPCGFFLNFGSKIFDHIAAYPLARKESFFWDIMGHFVTSPDNRPNNKQSIAAERCDPPAEMQAIMAG
jgi:hypothetical protein